MGVIPSLSPKQKISLARTARGAAIALICSAVCTVGSDRDAAADGILPTKAPPPSAPSAYDWTGFYLGGHAGYAWGNSDFSSPGVASGSLDLSQPINHFNEAGSWLLGLQGG